MFMKLFRSDDKFSQLLTQLESQLKIGGGSGSGRCGDDEQGDDEDDGEDGEDEDDSFLFFSNGELEPTPGVNRLLLMKHGSKIALADESIEMNEVESVGELGVNNLDRFPTRDELAYHRNEEDKQRGVEYVKNKVAEFYTRRLELGPEYEDGVEDHLEAKEVAM
ncbi:hypothetical protein Tco_1033588 [Tanacetum coccineum]